MRRISFAVLCVLRDDFVLELIDHGLALKIPDLDGGSGGGAEPVAVGREAQGVDNVGVVEGVQPFVVVQVSQHGFAVLQRKTNKSNVQRNQLMKSFYLATRGAQRTIRRYSDSVQVSSVVIMILLQTAVGQVPVLDHTIPPLGYNNWVVVVGGKLMMKIQSVLPSSCK